MPLIVVPAAARPPALIDRMSQLRVVCRSTIVGSSVFGVACVA
jgi:hypothetical protein